MTLWLFPQPKNGKGELRKYVHFTVSQFYQKIGNIETIFCISNMFWYLPST